MHLCLWLQFTLSFLNTCWVLIVCWVLASSYSLRTDAFQYDSQRAQGRQQSYRDIYNEDAKEITLKRHGKHNYPPKTRLQAPTLLVTELPMIIDGHSCRERIARNGRALQLITVQARLSIDPRSCALRPLPLGILLPHLSR